MYTLCSLLFETKKEYQKNLDTLLTFVDDTPDNSLVVAPEVCLSGFDYDNFCAAQEFSTLATKKIKQHSEKKIIILTLIEKKDNKIFNVMKVFHNGEVVYQRAKARLFSFGGEDKYFESGKDKDIKIVEVDGIKIAILVCFELRFKELWKLSEGADVIAIPSWWGVARKEHFLSLTKTLAIMNQCYVVAADALNEECSQQSGIITPMGKELRNGNTPCLMVKYDIKEIKKMRRYMDVGIG